jgi:hypothetical protein
MSQILLLAEAAHLRQRQQQLLLLRLLQLQQLQQPLLLTAAAESSRRSSGSRGLRPLGPVPLYMHVHRLLCCPQMSVMITSRTPPAAVLQACSSSSRGRLSLLLTCLKQPAEQAAMPAA